jgi:hypothetical protein
VSCLNDFYFLAVIAHSLAISLIPPNNQFSLYEKFVFTGFMLYWSYLGLAWGVQILPEAVVFDD